MSKTTKTVKKSVKKSATQTAPDKPTKPIKKRARTITNERPIFKLLVCGGRDYADKDALEALLDRAHKQFQITHLIHGGAKGADRLAGSWAWARGIQTVVCDANWQRYGNAAGPIRNQFMVELYPDAVLAFPGGNGTANMVEQASRHGIVVYDAAKLMRNH